MFAGASREAIDSVDIVFAAASKVACTSQRWRLADLEASPVA